MTSPLLINEPPLQVLPTLAERIGLHESIVLQQIHYWISNPKIGLEHEGKRWVRNSLEEWRESNFKFWSLSTIQRVLKRLLKLGLLFKTKLLNSNKYDHTLWYSIDYDSLNKRIKPSQNDTSDPVTLTKTPVTPSVPTNPATSESVKVTTSDLVKVTESYTESLSENTNTGNSNELPAIPPIPRIENEKSEAVALKLPKKEKKSSAKRKERKPREPTARDSVTNAIALGAFGMKTGDGFNASQGAIVIRDQLGENPTKEEILVLADRITRMYVWYRRTHTDLDPPAKASSIIKYLNEFSESEVNHNGKHSDTSKRQDSHVLW